MKFKARGLVALILTVVLGQALFIRATGAYTADQTDQPSESARIARFETLLESLRQELKIPAYSAAIVKIKRSFGQRDSVMQMSRIRFLQPNTPPTTSLR